MASQKGAGFTQCISLWWLHLNPRNWYGCSKPLGCTTLRLEYISRYHSRFYIHMIALQTQGTGDSMVHQPRCLWKLHQCATPSPFHVALQDHVKNPGSAIWVQAQRHPRIFSITHRIHVWYIYLHLVDFLWEMKVKIPYMDPIDKWWPFWGAKTRSGKWSANLQMWTNHSWDIGNAIRFSFQLTKKLV